MGNSPSDGGGTKRKLRTEEMKTSRKKLKADLKKKTGEKERVKPKKKVVKKKKVSSKPPEKKKQSATVAAKKKKVPEKKKKSGVKKKIICEKTVGESTEKKVNQPLKKNVTEIINNVCTWCGSKHNEEKSLIKHLTACNEEIVKAKQMSNERIRKRYDDLPDSGLTSLGVKRKWTKISSVLVDSVSYQFKKQVRDILSARRNSRYFLDVNSTHGLLIVLTDCLQKVIIDDARKINRGQLFKMIIRILNSEKFTIDFTCPNCGKGFTSDPGFRRHKLKCKKKDGWHYACETFQLDENIGKLKKNVITKLKKSLKTCSLSIYGNSFMEIVWDAFRAHHRLEDEKFGELGLLLRMAQATSNNPGKQKENEKEEAHEMELENKKKEIVKKKEKKEIEDMERTETENSDNDPTDAKYDEWAHGGETQSFSCLFCHITFFTKKDQVLHLKQCKKQMIHHVKEAERYFDLDDYVCDVPIQEALNNNLMKKEQFVLQLRSEIEKWLDNANNSNIETNLKLFEGSVESIDNTVGQMAVIFMRTLISIFHPTKHMEAIKSLKSYFKTRFVQEDTPHTLFQKVVQEVGQDHDVLTKLFSRLERIGDDIIENDGDDIVIHSENIPILRLNSLTAWLKKQIPSKVNQGSP